MVRFAHISCIIAGVGLTQKRCAMLAQLQTQLTLTDQFARGRLAIRSSAHNRSVISIPLPELDADDVASDTMEAQFCENTVCADQYVCART